MTQKSQPSRILLPLKNRLNLIYTSSILITSLTLVATISGLANPARFYPTHDLKMFSIPTDIISLGICLPLLIISMLLTRRGNLIGLLCWPGTLLYITYIYIIYILSQKFSTLFLLYLLLVALSAYTLIALITSIDSVGVKKHLKGSVPAKTTGIILTLIAAFFILVQVGELVNALINNVSKTLSDLAPFVSDFLTIAPAWLLGGIMLWRDKALGYTAGTGLLLLGSLLFNGLAFVIAFPTIYNGSQVDAIGIMMMLLMGAVCIIPLIYFIRGTQ